MGMGKTVQTLLMDLHPDQPATAGAAFNVARKLLGAAVTAFVLPLIDAIGCGWAFTAIGLNWIISFPVIPWLQVQGPRWNNHDRPLHDYYRLVESYMYQNHYLYITSVGSKVMISI